jgi:hypothetical protein
MAAVYQDAARPAGMAGMRQAQAASLRWPSLTARR